VRKSDANTHGIAKCYTYYYWDAYRDTYGGSHSYTYSGRYGYAYRNASLHPRTTHSHRAQERSCREPPTLETTAMIAPQSFHFRSR